MISGTPDVYCANYKIYDKRRRVTLEIAREAIDVGGRIISLKRGDSLSIPNRFSPSTVAYWPYPFI
ncbi:MAG: hypothetical protein HGA79_12550 [Anaerolineales bacterium]|nr:hypothetical protein [Anaerolineales bacterium]